ncbi:putative Embryo sac development arrest 6 [Melia azedarach]|uniref:Embryo sac development arrest 6 n=1 Tax=Melia azedarach TaxID=155640 RepID=A0ACC1YXU4_MELAZ|nr:putative Embryo sac development arrest 6 [Melia azedarach]
MNTKTMRLPPRRVLTPTKRKDRDEIDGPKPSTTKSLKPTTFQAGSERAQATAAEQADSSNQLLAGYLAHEFLTKGTLFGQPFDPARSQAVAVPVAKVRQEKKEEAEPSKGAEPQGEKYQRYVEVASLLKTDGAHIAGIVNPTQLARFLHM